MKTRTAARIAQNTYRQYGVLGTVRLVRATYEMRAVQTNPFKQQETLR